MKWIFLSLLFGNLIYFGWQFQAAESPVAEVKVPAPVKDSVSLTLLSELSDSPRVLPAKAAESAVRVCETLGPVTDELEVRHVLARLTALNMSGEKRELILPGESEYMVYHPPLASRKLAVRKLQEFKVRKVDSYIITQGERKNALSLGRFKQKELAYKHQKNLKKKKIAAKIHIIKSETRELWVDVRLQGDFVLDGRTRQRIQAELQDVSWQKVACGEKQVVTASPEN